MCGIYGEVRIRGDGAPDEATVRAMGALIRHRGPDDDGLHLDDGAALGLRRLSIIDVGGGHQPLAGEDGTVVAVCNGEIYNFRALRNELKGQGHVFRTGSDAEVLVHLYEEHGEDFVGRLEGMFGFALWDRRRRRFLLGRDRLGIKPVYYAELGGRLAFASEAKAIAGRGDCPRDLDPEGLAQFLALGYVPQPYSLFRGIRKLPPGHVLRVEGGEVTLRRYWRFEPKPDDSLTEEAWVDAIRSALLESVESQMVSDVPLGAFLSGGIDSSAIVASMSRVADAPVRTYSIGYAGASGAALYNELPEARLVARRFGTEHHEIVVQPEVVGLLPGLVWHMDEPTSDTALVTSSLVSEFASRDVKVILSGVGGDELFGGYERYLLPYYAERLRRIPGPLRRGVLNPLLSRVPVARHLPLLNLFRSARKVAELADMSPASAYRRLMEVLGPEERVALLPGGAAPTATALDLALREYAEAEEGSMHMAVDLVTQLPDDLLLLTDKMSMAHSLECRVPLLDERLVNLAAALPARHRTRAGRTRYLLRRALKDLVPEETLERKKRGFGAPFGAWLTRELAPVTARLLAPEAIRRRGLLDPAGVQRLVGEHRRARADHTDALVALITLELWCRLYLDGEDAGALSAELSAGSEARSG